ncbi:VCBS domain-containing protein [Bradyrhizobium sp. CB3481]|uniref:VCBS domain-containing protein n=1 Tax=Bradyrhizobium sp. CB3481 TaxID=3039158 RepID=UPI0024B27A8C|nr:VCBS domain-containing protein [Bradyrhizobium sp. CB3481]WFU15923.1 VCBS domain-containing protein [Bradyrhizobium sp. CB3481]
MAKTGSLRIDTPVGIIRGRAQAGGFGMLSLTALTFAVMSDVKAADPDATFLDDDNIAYKDLEHGAFELWTKEAIPRHIIVEDPSETVVLTRRGSSVNVSQVANSAIRMEELQAAQQAVLANYAKGYGPGGSSTPYYLDLPKLQPINYGQAGGSTPLGTLPPLPEGPSPFVIEPFIPPPQPPSLNSATGPTLIDTAALDLFIASGGSFAASSSEPGATLTFGIGGGTAGNTVMEGITYNISKAGLYGTLFLNSTTGAYLYVPNNAAVNALSAPTTENFTITVSDGTLSVSQTYTVIINGTNDAAIIAGTITGSVTEASGTVAGTSTATGTLTDTDVDNPPNTFTEVSSATPSAKGYGTFTITAAGVWTYTLDNTNAAVQALNVGTTLIDTFTVATIDGTTQLVTITITGANDAAVISGAKTGSVVEASGTSPGTPVATGTLTDTDVDNVANSFIAVLSPTTSNNGYGSFIMTAAGVWTYTLDNANAAVQALNTGETLTDTFTVATVDGTTQVVTITITGANDAAIVSGTITGAVVEAGTSAPGTPVATGALTASDADNAANAFTAVSSPTASSKGYGSFTMTAAGVWTYTLDNSNPAVQALNVGGTLTDTFTVTTVDGTTQVVTITIAGTNDAAVIFGTTTGSVIEAGTAAPGAPVATGTLADTDVDNAANTFAAVSSPAASSKGYGSFTMTAAGVWTYTLDNTNSAVQALNAGETLTDTFTVATVDGTTQVVTITITGANDAAVISGTKTGSVVEATGTAAGIPVATGTLTDVDVDNADNSFVAVTSPAASSKGYGSFTITAAGVWTYTLDNTNPAVQALNVGGTLTDTFTVAAVDGTTQVMTITIAGANDAAVISGATTGSVTEAGTTTPGTPVATGTLTDTDVDNAANTFAAVSSPTASTKGYGTFMITVAGVWTYMLDNNNSTVQALDPGETLTDTFTVATIDGTTQTVTIVIHGSSDADPNDFDNLALGDHVIVDAPYVYGTPNGENIAGGGDEFQIVYAGAGNDTVNGTGKDDILYSGSGNDTIKGNDGNDTIYGGSGNDTVNGNNGSDTITGGFGADQLTGSNGDDVFVYLSVADSNSSQFDTITDFASGSDKINLAALGALAFLHLTSTSTPVPPHTIAWIYNSASNETIVYVNPTDTTLKIGDSSLLEIHLQGIVSVQESDFIFQAADTVVAASEAIDLALETLVVADAAAVTEASAETSASTNDALIASDSSGWVLSATDESSQFHFKPDVGSVGSVKLAHFGETSASAMVDSDEATVALTAGSAIEPWDEYTATPTESLFTFHQESIQANAGAVTIGETTLMSPIGTIQSLGFTATYAVAASQHVEHGVSPVAGANHPSQHESHAAAGSNDPDPPANAVAASQLAQLGVTPGSGAGHQPSQHEPHAASQQSGFNGPHTPANAVAASQLAQLGVTPGSGASHQQSQHEPHTASQQSGPSEPHLPLSSPPAAANPSHQADHASGGPAPAVNDPGHGNSFHFKNEVAAIHTEPIVSVVELNSAPIPGAGGHGAEHGGSAAILETETAALSQTEQHPGSHAYVASHGSHELLI